MDYPVSILPNPAYKYIDCPLDGHYLLRHVDTNNPASLLDPVTNKLLIKCICPQSDHIYDLSTSLLGIFKVEHIHLSFTDAGGAKFYSYCLPDEIVDVPVFETEFIFKEDRAFWYIAINSLHNKEFPYNVGEENFIATCLVRHTPMKWNYWHFSLRWTTNHGSLDDMEEKQRKKFAKKIGHSALVAISQFAKVGIPEHTLPPQKCYCKN